MLLVQLGKAEKEHGQSYNRPGTFSLFSTKATPNRGSARLVFGNSKTCNFIAEQNQTNNKKFKRKRKPKEVSCVKCSHHRPVQDGGAESLLWGQTCPSKCLLRPCKWFSGEGQCPLENLFSGSPTTAVQPRTGEVAWWPEMAEGEVQLTAVGGLVLFCNLRKCYILSCHSQVKGKQKALPMLKKGVHCQNRRKRV